MAHFKPLKGENARRFFVGCLPTAIPDFLTPKTRGNACHLFRGCLLVPFRFQNRPFRRQTRLNLAPERSIFGLVLLSAVALQFSAPGARVPQTTATNHPPPPEVLWEIPIVLWVFPYQCPDHRPPTTTTHEHSRISFVGAPRAHLVKTPP